MIYQVKYGQTIFDVAIIAYQDASRIYDLIADNPQIENIDSDLTGMTLEFIESKLTQKEAIKTVSSFKKSVTIKNTQSLFDISLQYFGGAESIYDLILSNGIDSIMADATGKTLNYEVNKTFTPSYFRKTGGEIASKLPTDFVLERYRITTNNRYRITSGGKLRIVK